MPRIPNARARVTNKSRLKIVQGNIDADPLVLDEDEEKARVVSTAGVDAEDANVRANYSTHFSSFVPALVGTAPVAHAHWLATLRSHSMES